MVDQQPDPLVEAHAVVRRFGARTALGGIDLAVGPGEVVGLIGPNGSGKSTLLRLLAGLLRPTAGRVAVFGLDPFRHRAAVMRRARFAFAPPALYDDLTAREHLRHLAGATGSAASEALAAVGLVDRADDRAGTFSFGLRQRLLLALALTPLPELLVLDEPTDGLDPLAIAELRAVLARLRRDHGVAILLASHLLAEIEELVDRVLVLHDGAPLLAGAPRALTAARRRLHLTVSDSARGRAALGEHGVAGAGRVGADILELPPGSVDLRTADRVLAAAGVDLRGYAVVTPSLETLVLEALREA